MRKICGIYKITNNINGMEYCGQSQDCVRRWYEHRKTYTNVCPIDKAINEYGKENFTFSILLECPPDMLDVWEKDMINLFDTYYPNGYNRFEGGKNKYGVCVESRRKMSESTKGKKKPPITEETRIKMSESHKGKTPWNKDKTWSEDVRRKISESITGISKTKYKYLTPDGEIKEMSGNHASRWHPDWIKIEE